MNLDSVLAFLKVILIDVSLSGDNAVVIGMAASTLPQAQRLKAISLGILGAIVLRVAFSAGTVEALAVPHIATVGGILLLWVAYKMWGEMHQKENDDFSGVTPDKTLFQAVWQIIIADVSMSLDNVLAVAGAARDNLQVMVFGLVMSIGMMAVASNMIASLLNKYKWISYIGFWIIMYVAADMILTGLGIGVVVVGLPNPQQIMDAVKSFWAS